MSMEREEFHTFIRDRITALRLSKGVSEYEMSLALGRNRSYIQNIVRGQSLPSMDAFLDICDYCGITPQAFFDDGQADPAAFAEIRRILATLNAEQLSKVHSFLSLLEQ